MNVAQLLREMPATKVARACGVSRSTVYRWGDGDCAPGGESLAKLIKLSGGRVTAGACARAVERKRSAA